MKKRLIRHWRGFIVIAFVLLLTMASCYGFYKEVREQTGIASENALVNGGTTFTMFFDDKVKRFTRDLQMIADKIKFSDIKDGDMLDEIFADYSDMFFKKVVYNCNGQMISGDKVVVSSISGGMLEDVVYGKKVAVYDTVLTENDGQECILICVPIIKDDKVIAVLGGEFRAAELSKYIDSWGVDMDGCAFVMTKNGKYLTSGKKFKKILGSEANSFMTYLSNASINKKGPTRDDIEKSIKKRENTSFRFNNSGDSYTCVLNASKYGKWYVVYVINNSETSDSVFVPSEKIKILIGVNVVLWVVVLIGYIINIYRIEKYKEKEEREEILNEMEKSIVFEYTFFPKQLSFFGDGNLMFGREMKTLLGEEVYEVYDYVHPDDKSIRGRIHQFYDDGTGIFTAELRVKNADGYGWYRIVGKMLRDKKFGNNIKFIGKIENADQEIAEEKNLVQRAENDLLTGVLNKKTMEEKVVKAVESISGNTRCIFFMVDLDNFKNVNDKLGHISGDKAIVDTADRLTEIFPNNAFVGRLGGDEFSVCVLYDAFDEESLEKYIKKKAEKICEVNRRTYSNGETEVSISSSVGISYAPNHARDFQSLYKMADKALYKSKNGGKNCYNIYEG